MQVHSYQSKADDKMSNDFNVSFSRESTSSGGRYTFFCGATGVEVYSTGFIHANNAEMELSIAKREAREHFNRCSECGTWVGDEAYNIDEGKCVICAPVSIIWGHRSNAR